MKPPSPGRHRKIIHILIEGFYAAIEQRDQPELAGQPVIIAAEPSGSGAIAALSTAASAYGIRLDMAVKTAQRLCPHLVCLPPDFSKYRRTAEQLHGIFAEYTDLVEAVASDATYLDVTYNKLDIPFGHRVAKMIKADVRRHLGLNATAGVAPNKFLAQLAANLAKPDTTLAILPDQVKDFLHPLGVERLPGLGQVTRQHLKDLGVYTIGQLAAHPSADLAQRLGWRSAHLQRLAQGFDQEPVGPQTPPSSLDAETAGFAPIYRRDEMIDTLVPLVEELSARLRRRGLMGRIISLEIGYADFGTASSNLTLASHSDRCSALLQGALQLLQASQASERGVRRFALAIAGFPTQATEQLDLFAD